MKTKCIRGTLVASACVLAVMLMLGGGSIGLAPGQAEEAGIAPPSVDIASDQSGGMLRLFVKFDDIEGESYDSQHPEWCEAISFSQGLMRGGASASRHVNITFDDILIRKWLDKASPKIAESLCKGKRFPQVKIHLAVVSTEFTKVFYEYILKGVRVVSYNIQGPMEDSFLPVEEVAIAFEQINVTYTEFDADGTIKSKVEYSYTIGGEPVK